jgi:acetyl esterase/lipase
LASSQLSTLRAIFRARSSAHRFHDPRKARRELEQFVAALPGPGDHEATPATVGGVPGEWIQLPEGAPEVTLILLHGGGYVSGSLASHRGLAARIAAVARARVFVVDYRRAPEHRFPAAFDDSLAAVRAVLEGADDPAAVGLVGDSAGGGLTLAVSVALRDGGHPLPAALACLSPWVDLTVSGESLTTRADADPLFDRPTLAEMAGLYADGHALTDPRISPLHAELHGLPPTLIQTGDAEVMLSDSTRLAERLESAGVETELEVWPEMIHGWQLFAGLLPEGTEAIERIGRFLARHVRRTVTP